MAISELLLPEFDEEIRKTRISLEKPAPRGPEPNLRRKPLTSWAADSNGSGL
jgi:hypothetical protein